MGGQQTFTKEFTSLSALAVLVPGAESPPPQIDEPDQVLLAYFFHHLDEFCHDPDFCDQFKKNWRDLETEGLSARELTNILYHIAKFSKTYKGKSRLIEHLHDHAVSWERPAIEAIKNWEFSAQDLSLSLYAHAVLGIRPSNEFMQAWEEHAIRAMEVGEFNAQNLSNSLYAHAVLNIRPSDAYLQAWEERAINGVGLDYFNEQNLSNSLYALGILDAITPANENVEITARLAGRINNQIGHLVERNDFHPRGRNSSQVAQACLWFDLESHVYPEPESHTVSRYEFQFLGLVNNALTGDFNRVEAQDTVISETLGHKVDGVYEKDGHRYYVEVDGPSHFVRQRDPEGQWMLRYNGSTMFQTALIQKLAPEASLLRVPYPVSDRIMGMDQDDRRQSIRQIFSNAVHKAGQGVDAMIMGPHRTKPGRLTARRLYPDHEPPLILQPAA